MAHALSLSGDATLALHEPGVGHVNGETVWILWLEVLSFSLMTGHDMSGFVVSLTAP
jgi:hypothetical protein